MGYRQPEDICYVTYRGAVVPEEFAVVDTLDPESLKAFMIGYDQGHSYGYQEGLEER